MTTQPVTAAAMQAAMEAIGRTLAHVAARHGLDREDLARRLISSPLQAGQVSEAEATGLLLALVAQQLVHAPPEAKPN